jgi:hypothetical protein
MLDWYCQAKSPSTRELTVTAATPLNVPLVAVTLTLADVLGAVSKPLVLMLPSVVVR